MPRQGFWWFVVAGAVLWASCDVKIPNGVFACVNATDCPSGFFCWNSDGRCYDADEPNPVCVPSTCEQVIAQFASLGVLVECGMLPDGCEGTVECPPCGAGETCGANDKNFVCGCEEATCSSTGAQCGAVEAGCGSGETIDCGECPGSLECVANQCECTSGDCECPEGCDDGQICVEGECCAPLFPCSDNECSPSGGLPDGCGGMVDCPPCDAKEECTPSLELGGFECIGECSCESEGVECGTASVCGTSQFCGICESASAPLCQDGRCVCEDWYERNEDPSAAALVECTNACSTGSLQIEVEATLDRPSDYDFYRVKVEHAPWYAFRADLSGLDSTRQILMGYQCPDGSERIADCSGSSGSFGSSKFCVEDSEDTLRLVQECVEDAGVGTLIVGISAKEGEFRGPCDTYSLLISSFFFEYDD